MIVDETYTFGRDTYSRQNLHVLTSIDYAKMSAEDKAKEQNPRPDGDYALSWIRREGKGRVFYEAHGHNEKIYAIKPMLEHLTAGMQYALGDLAGRRQPQRQGRHQVTEQQKHHATAKHRRRTVRDLDDRPGHAGRSAATCGAGRTTPQSVEAIHAAVDHGINWIDTAPIYGSGHSEEVVGRAVKAAAARRGGR